jgi:hypothetical protein
LKSSQSATPDRCVVLKDACFDADEEVHRVLMGKNFPEQATVMTVEEFIGDRSWQMGMKIDG